MNPFYREKLRLPTTKPGFVLETDQPPKEKFLHASRGKWWWLPPGSTAWVPITRSRVRRALRVDGGFSGTRRGAEWLSSLDREYLRLLDVPSVDVVKLPKPPRK